MELTKVTFNNEPVTLKGTQLEVNDTAPSFKVVANDLSVKTEEDYSGKLTLISVVPSIDTGVCSAQTTKFNQEADKFEDVNILTVSMDLPFAQGRWCSAEGVENLTMLSDYRYASFGENYGVLIEELRLLARSIFIIGEDNKVKYVEYVNEVTDHPNYDAALEKLKELAQ